MKILITGVSGFIGSYMAAALISLGHDILGTYRNNPPRAVTRYKQGFMDQKEHKGSLTTIQADLSNKETIRELIRNVDGIIHIAGLTTDWGTTQQFHQSNVLPLQHFIDAFNEADRNRELTVRFFIYTSTISVHSFGKHVNSTEDGPYYRPCSLYQNSKIEGEGIILKRAAADSKPAIAIIRPGNVYGPGDTTVLYPILDATKTGKMMYIDKGKYLTSPIFIDDLISAYIALMNKLLETPAMVHGSLYNITSGENITWKEMMEICAQHADLKKPQYSFPEWFGLIIAYVLTGLFRIVHTKTPPEITPYRIRFISNDYHFSITKAMNELDWKPKTTFSEGIIPSIEAWKHERF